MSDALFTAFLCFSIFTGGYLVLRIPCKWAAEKASRANEIAEQRRRRRHHARHCGQP